MTATPPSHSGLTEPAPVRPGGAERTRSKSLQGSAEISESRALGASVVIAAMNSEESIGETVRALLGQRDAAGNPVEIIVVDDGSSDATGERAEAAGARVLRIPNGGPAVARNRGVEQARAPIIVFTDADCRPAPGFVAALTKPLIEGRAQGSKGAYRSEQRSLTARFVQLEYESRYRRMARFESIDFIDTYAAAYETALFRSLGGFDESFSLPSVEDQELSFRMAEAGARMVFVPEAITFHLHVDCPIGYLRKKMKIGRHKVTVLRRHPGKLVSDSHTPQGLKLQLPVALLALPALPALLASLAAGEEAFALVAAAPLLLLLLLAAPLAFANAKKDLLVGLLSPGFVFLRGLGLGLGLILGAGRLLCGSERP